MKLKPVNRSLDEENYFFGSVSAKGVGSGGLSTKSESQFSMKSDGTRTPSSPTDQILSPVSRRLLLRKSQSREETDSFLKTKKGSLSLSDIQPIPFPAPQLDFIFGTSSKFRKAIIDQLSWSYTQISPDINEKAIRTDDPIDLPILIAEAKAAVIVEQLKSNQVTSEKLILTADQIVLFEERIREKPENDEEAIQFLSSYSEKSVSTVSAVVITHYPSGLQYSGFDIATIHWKRIPQDVVLKVVAKKEIFNCAGGFRIEDEDLRPLISSIDGSFDSVLGLPIKITINLITEVLSYLHEPEDPTEFTQKPLGLEY